MNKTHPASYPALTGGFTLVELIVILVLVGILSVAIIPRFADRQTFDTRGAFDEVSSSLRFARQQAVAQRRQVCVAVTSGGLGVTQASSPPPAACDGRAVVDPATGAALSVAMPDGVSLAANGATAALPATIRFDALGQADAAGLRVNGDGAFCLAVEAGTGYVHAVVCP
ncbi:pilus assembly FimT family protein [Propionivibrio limicola]|uniref:pilus assembly FimT family protein n=1 Tax=Propionivibrio limicola TaxID=167645 RepID=UPI001478F993|nr:GspH/FimT family pseudopilin [Propionivibrio limicola]